MWFWRKRAKVTYTDPILGELDHGHDVWSGKTSLEGFGEIQFSVTGDKAKPDEHSLRQAKSILGEFGTLLSAAKNYLKSQDLGEWSDPRNGDLVCDGFDAKAEAGSFELNFGLSEWPDAMIGVEFRGGRPVEVHLAD